MSETNETIADIVAEIRNKTGDMYDSTITMFEDEFHSYADRIEAAAKREECELLAQIAELRQKIDDGEFFTPKAARDAIAGERPLDEMLKAPLPTGNAAAMREALYMMRRISDEMNGETFGKGDEEIVKGWANTLRYYSDKALSAPPRNCDVGTAEEQHNRWVSYCDSKTDCDSCDCSKARLDGITSKCLSRWMQMPYAPDTKKEGGEG